jgi:hypothetical protein
MSRKLSAKKNELKDNTANQRQKSALRLAASLKMAIHLLSGFVLPVRTRFGLLNTRVIQMYPAQRDMKSTASDLKVFQVLWNDKDLVDNYLP